MKEGVWVCVVHSQHSARAGVVPQVKPNKEIWEESAAACCCLCSFLKNSCWEASLSCCCSCSLLFNILFCSLLHLLLCIVLGLFFFLHVLISNLIYLYSTFPTKNVTQNAFKLWQAYDRLTLLYNPFVQCEQWKIKSEGKTACLCFFYLFWTLNAKHHLILLQLRWKTCNYLKTKKLQNMSLSVLCVCP